MVLVPMKKHVGRIRDHWTPYVVSGEWAVNLWDVAIFFDLPCTSNLDYEPILEDGDRGKTDH